MLNLRESLLSYQSYFEQLLKEKEVITKKVKSSNEMRLLEAKQAGNQEEEKSIVQAIDEQIQQIEKKFNAAIDQLVRSYDEHMKKILPNPKLLPIRVSVQIDGKSRVRIENIHIKPYDTINDIFAVIEEF